MRTNGQALRRLSRLLSALILLTATGVGMIAFLWPFFAPSTQGTTALAAHSQDAPLMFLLLILLGLGATVVDLTLGQMDSQTVAILGVLAALGAALRLVPGPGGFSALFLLPILGGYVYGPSFGFLLGTLTLVVSSLISGGVGPWLPYQMFAAGWVGALAGLWGQTARRFGWGRATPSRLETGVLALWGAILGMVYGAIMNLWFWPFVFQPQQAGMYWQPGLGIRQTLARYLLFYLTTSLWWDAGRAIGNALLVIVVGRPLLRGLYRLRLRTEVTIVPAPTEREDAFPAGRHGVLSL